MTMCETVMVRRTSKSHSIIVISHSVSEVLDQHRSREFKERMEFFAEHYGLVRIISLNASSDRNTHRISNTHEIYITPLRMKSLQDQIRLFYILRNNSTVFVDSESDMFNTLLALLFSRTRPVLLFQGLVIDQFLFSLQEAKLSKVFRSIIGFLTMIFEKVSLRIPRDIICVSKGILNHAWKLLGSSSKSKLHYLPHSLSYTNQVRDSELPAAITEAINQDVTILSYLGRLAKSKRVDIALKSFAILIESGHSAKLALVGDGPEKEYLIQLTHDLGISEHVIFTGHVSQEIALSILTNSKVMIFPSESEGFSWSVVESLAMGCPVVAYKYATSIDDGLNQAVVLVDSFNPSCFSDEVEKILVDDGLHKSLVEKGKLFSKSFIAQTPRMRFTSIVDIIDRKHMHK